MCILSLFNQTLTKIIYFVEVVTVLDAVFQSITAHNLISNKNMDSYSCFQHCWTVKTFSLHHRLLWFKGKFGVLFSGPFIHFHNIIFLESPHGSILAMVTEIKVVLTSKIHRFPNPTWPLVIPFMTAGET